MSEKEKHTALFDTLVDSQMVNVALQVDILKAMFYDSSILCPYPSFMSRYTPDL